MEEGKRVLDDVVYLASMAFSFFSPPLLPHLGVSHRSLAKEHARQPAKGATSEAYYGGEARCDAEVGEEYDPTELVCGACSDVSRAQMCPKHGTDFLEYKCRYCCSTAVFFCFGTTHFCNACHDDFQRVTNIPRLELPTCPAGADFNDCEFRTGLTTLELLR
uniref:Uncharacterized protein n=1 Tax=Timema tahoe TaxID=61484 RepID=A0A7R9ICN5_9NEOP|nr:unnamed protein product [Timema tahoe]